MAAGTQRADGVVVRPVALVPAQRVPPPAPASPAPPPPAPKRRTRRLAVAVTLLLTLLGAPASAGPEPVATPTTRAYFLGDSLMAGTGASPRRPVMARIAAARLGWDVEVDAWGGTGYTTTGRSPGYLDRLRRPGALAGSYDVVLLEGGYNDARVGSTPEQVHAAASAVVEHVRARQPGALVVLMGSYDPPGQANERRAAIDDAIESVAAEHGLPFFSPISGGWTAGLPAGRFLHPDGVHPTAWGYGVMAERLVAELARLVAARG